MRKNQEAIVDIDIQKKTGTILMMINPVNAVDSSPSITSMLTLPTDMRSCSSVGGQASPLPK
jgi:hypothetical protein